MAVVIVSGWAGAVFSAELAVRMVADDLDFHRAGRTGRGNKLGHATVTQINNDVRYQPGNGAERRAAVRDVVRGADLVRTGLKSQAELGGSTLTPGPTSTAYIYTDHLLSPPSSGAYQVQPLASAPR
jgi:hypothetical protein